jgi:hypothetical protein
MATVAKKAAAHKTKQIRFCMRITTTAIQTDARANRHGILSTFASKSRQNPASLFKCSRKKVPTYLQDGSIIYIMTSFQKIAVTGARAEAQTLPTKQ